MRKRLLLAAVPLAVTVLGAGTAYAFLTSTGSGTSSANVADVQPVSISADPIGPFYPGTSLPLNMTFTNPSSAPVTIKRGEIVADNIQISSPKPDCNYLWFQVNQGLTANVKIPANQTAPVSLQALGINKQDWPVVRMVDTSTDQGACQGVSLNIAYSGVVVRTP